MLAAVVDDPRDEGPSHADPARYAELAGFGDDYRGLWHNPDYLAFLGARWRLDRCTTLLDVGCGAGHFGLSLLPHLHESATLTGVDSEPAFLDALHERAAVAGVAHRLGARVGQATALPFPDGAFDLVVCHTLLIHVPDPAAVVAEMARVTAPSGIVLCCEPDNLAGDVALLGSSLGTSDDDVIAIVRLLLTCHAGKRALGEGDERVGHRLPGLLDAAGLADVDCRQNDRCMTLLPPYARDDMQLMLDRELTWADQGIALMGGDREDARRLFRAASPNAAAFERGWTALSRWREGFAEAARAGTFAAARGYVMYMAAGRRSA